MATNFDLSVNDARGDVSNPDIDIIKAWTKQENGNIVFHIQVAGRINNSCYYLVTATNGSEEVGAIYSNGNAFYSGSSSTTAWGRPQATIENGNILVIKVPSGVFSSWKHFAFRAFAGEGYMTGDFTQQVGDVGNENNGGEKENEKDPTKETPTDTSIKVEIKEVKYNIKKTGNNVDASILIKGTTNGADHVSICYVIYYKNGTHEYTGWIRGPISLNTSYNGYEITQFFDPIHGQWDTWEFRMNGTFPITNYSWLYGENEEKKVSRISIYARAFKDAEETKWNQCHYDTTPNFSGAAVLYGENQNKEKKKTPGFEIFALAVAIAIAFAMRRK